VVKISGSFYPTVMREYVKGLYVPVVFPLKDTGYYGYIYKGRMKNEK